MDRTIQIAQARFAIEEILFCYAESLDTGDLETMAGLFLKGLVRLPDGSVLEGPEAVFAHYHKMVQFYSAKGKKKPYKRLATTPMTRHVTTNVRCDIDNAVRSAKVSSYFTVYQQNKSKIELIAGGRYEDIFAKDLAGWHITRRAFHIDQQGDMSRHLKAG